VASAQTWFVDLAAPTGGTGNSWATAFDEIEDAFAEINMATAANHTILLREGLYRPTPSTTTDPRERSFVISPIWTGTVRIVGGFLGGSTGGINPNTPDGSPVRTILDGRAFTVSSVTTGPAYHILTVGSSNAPGFTLSVENLLMTGGRADDYLATTGNLGAQGGAVLVRRDHSFMLFDRVTFLDNQAGPPATFTGTPALRGQGGAIAVLQNGAIGTASVTLKRCTFLNNHAEFGAAVFVEISPSLQIGNCRFVENGFFPGDTTEVQDDAPPMCLEGGALLIGALVNSEMNNTVFQDNNTVFQDNLARDAGGAVHWRPVPGANSGAALTQIMRHCTIAFNRISNFPNGAGLHIAPANQQTDARTYEIFNSILFGNIGGNDLTVLGDPAIPSSGATANLRFCDVGTQAQPNTFLPGGIIPLIGVISANPLFVSPATRNLALQSQPVMSPCIDSGGTTYSIPVPPSISNAVGFDIVDIDDDNDFGEVLPLDFNFQLRIQGAGPDMGAYEQ